MAADQVRQDPAGLGEADVRALADGKVTERLGDVCLPDANGPEPNYGLSGVEPAQGGEVPDLGRGKLRRGREVELLERNGLLELRPVQASLKCDGLAAGDLILAEDLEEFEVPELAAVSLGEAGVFRACPTASAPSARRAGRCPCAILCRTNVGAMTHLLAHLDTGHRVALVGGGNGLRTLAEAAQQLKEGRRASHPELFLFATWAELQDYAQHDPAGADLQAFVDLIDTHGTRAVLNAVHRLTQEPHAQVTISTAHKAKGREWPTVRIADDFHPPRGTDTTDPSGNPTPDPVNNAEARLAYVAVTRSRTQLDIGGLGWIHSYPDGQPQ